MSVVSIFGVIRRDHQGVAALEFALVLPLLIVLVFGVYELSEPMILYQEVYSAAHSIPSSASSLAVQADASTSLTYAQVQFEASAIFAEIPALRAGLQNGAKSVTISSVVFEPTNSTCETAATKLCFYKPNVVWSVAYTGGDSGMTFEPKLRHCGILQQTNPGQGTVGDLTSLPTLKVTWPDPALAPPDPILVVDVHLRYQPLLLRFTRTPIDFWATGYWPVRSVKASTVGTDGSAVPLRSDQQYTTLTGLSGAPPGSYCVNGNYPLIPS